MLHPLKAVNAMTKDNSEIDKQMAAARETMDRYREALSALAENENTSEEFPRQLEVARERMEKYKGVYRALAK